MDGHKRKAKAGRNAWHARLETLLSSIIFNFGILMLNMLIPFLATIERVHASDM